jgi:spore germination protein PE
LIPRTSAVGNIRINTVGSTSMLEIGDSKQMNLVNGTIAVQREKAIFWQNEFDFSDYRIFSIPLVQPVVHENMTFNVINQVPEITVNRVEVFLLSSSSTLHVGSSGSLNAQARIKHIRHLLKEGP